MVAEDGYGTFASSGDLTSVRLKPSYVQDAFKTVTLALAPFVPFSQTYTMELQKMQGVEGSTVNTSGPSFFNITPMETGYDPKWEADIDSYLSKIGGEKEIGDLAPNVNHLLTPMAQKLAALLEAIPGEAKFHQKKMESSVLGELVGEYSMDKLRDTLIASGDVVGASPMAVVEDMTETKEALSRQTFDMQRTNITEPFFKSMSKMFTKIDMDRVAAAEVTDSKFGKEISKVAGGLQGMSGEEAMKAMDERVKLLYGRINKAMSSAITAGLKSKTISPASTNQELLKYVHSDAALAKNAVSAAKDLPRQFADRFWRLAAQEAATPRFNSYLYTLPLGDTRYIANLQIWVEWTGEIPQIEWQTEYVKGVEKKDQSDYFFINLGLAVQKELNLTNAIFTEKTMATIELAAVNDMYAVDARMRAADWAMVSMVDNALSPDAHVDMLKLHKGQMGAQGASRLTSSDMAAMLANQFKSLQSDNAGEKFVEAWRKIFIESNKATGLWKKAVVNKYKQINHIYKDGLTNEQGVWSEDTNETWRPPANPKYGHNVSMAPVVSSQAGRSVSRITASRKSKKKAVRADPEGLRSGLKFNQFGLTQGQMVNEGARFIDWRKGTGTEYDKFTLPETRIGKFL